MTTNRTATSRPTIGLLLDWLEGEYQSGLFAGAAEAARESDANLICFTGGVLKATRWFWAERNSAFELVGPDSVDGLIITSTIANSVGTEQLVQFCQRFRPLPMCSIAVPMPDVPGITVDHAGGFREGLRHLVEVHRRRRIAFIRGPEGSEEAERRFLVYKEVLAAAGLPLATELIAGGDFLRASGATAVRRWIEKGVQLDAVVAANDEMALAALESLLALGVRVPDSVSVMGFDDSEEARFSAPSLTTVRQPVRELGRRAVTLLLEQLRTGSCPAHVQFASEFIARHSCGCARRVSAGLVSGGSAGRGLESISATERARLVNTVTQTLAGEHRSLEPRWAARLLDGIVADLAGSNGRFIAGVKDLCARLTEADARIHPVQDALTALREQVLMWLAPGDVETRDRFEALLHEGRAFVAEQAQAAEGMKRVRLQRWARTVAETSKAFLVTLDLPSLLNEIVDQFPRLQIPSCYLALYEDPKAPAEWAHMLLACDMMTPGRRWPYLQAAVARGGASGEARFRSRELIPRNLLPARRFTFVLEPLFYRDEQQGYVLLETGPSDGGVYEGLRDQISGALKGAIQVQRVADERNRRHAMEKAEMDLEKERFIASGIQSMLTPRTLRTGALEVAAAVSPAGRLGGSVGDAVDVPGGCQLWVAHTGTDGLAGALTSFMIQSVVLGRVIEQPDVPAGQVVSAVQGVLERRRPMDGAVMPVLTVARVHGHQVELAGDPQWALLCRAADGKCLELTAGSGGQQQTLDPDDVLLLFSRGVVEMQDARHEQFGRERLARTLCELRSQPIHAIRDGLLSALKQWTAVQREDVVLVVARRLRSRS